MAPRVIQDAEPALELNDGEIVAETLNDCLLLNWVRRASFVRLLHRVDEAVPTRLRPEKRRIRSLEARTQSEYESRSRAWRNDSRYLGSQAGAGEDEGATDGAFRNDPHL